MHLNSHVKNRLAYITNKYIYAYTYIGTDTAKHSFTVFSR